LPLDGKAYPSTIFAHHFPDSILYDCSGPQSLDRKSWMIREIFCGIFSFKERSRRCDDHEEITHPCSRPRWRWRRSKAIKPWPSSERIRALLFFLVLPFLFFRAGKALLAGYTPFAGDPISALIPRWAWRNFFARTKKKTKRKGSTKIKKHVNFLFTREVYLCRQR